MSGRLNRPPRRAERRAASAGTTFPVTHNGGNRSPLPEFLRSPSMCNFLLSTSRARRALRARAWLVNTGLASAAAMSGRLNRPPRRAERCVACARTIFPVGGLVRIGPPPTCQPVVSLKFHPLFCSALPYSARFARAHTAPLYWAIERACHVWAPKQAAPAGRALRGTRTNNVPCGGTNRDRSPPWQPVVTLKFHPHFCSALPCSARFARARTAPQHWASERGWHLWAPEQAAPAGTALRGKRGHNNPYDSLLGEVVPPYPTF